MAATKPITAAVKIGQRLFLFDHRFTQRPLATLVLCELNCDGAGKEARFEITSETGNARPQVVELAVEFQVALRREDGAVASVVMTRMEPLGQCATLSISGASGHQIKG